MDFTVGLAGYRPHFEHTNPLGTVDAAVAVNHESGWLLG